ncbi:MAG: hypothetical protein ACJ8F7_12900 [Gemmataceae bacterium]
MTAVLLSLLLAADPATTVPPGRVSLTGAEKTLGDAAASLSRQANVLIDLERAVKTQPLQLRFDSLPFWEALERLAKAANHRLVVEAQGSRIALLGGPGVSYRPMPLYIFGPFRVSARRVISRLDLDTGLASTELFIDVVWEPRFRAFHAEVPAKSWSARDEAGKPLPIGDDGSGKMSVTGTGLDLTARLPGLPRTVQKIARLDGKLVLVGTSESLQFTFDASAAGDGSAQTKAGVGATLKSFKKAGPFWTAAVEFAYPPGGPEFESFQSYLRDNEVWLLRGDGVKFPAIGFELGAEHNGRTTVLYRFKENEKDGPVLTNVKEWKLVVRAPGRITEVAVPFTLTDVPLR